MAVAIGDVFLTTWAGTWDNQRIMLTHTYEIVNAIGAPDEQTVADDLLQRLTSAGLDIMETSYLNCMPQDYQLQLVTAQKIYPVRYRSRFLTFAKNGNIANNALTGNNAAVISFHTDLAGRSQVSNKHVGPLATAVGWFDNGVLTAGYKAVLGALANAMRTTVTAAGVYSAEPAIYHRAAVVPKSDYITGHIVQDTVRTQRRRTVGLGI